MTDARTLERRIGDLLARFPDRLSGGEGEDAMGRRRFLLTSGAAMSAALVAACNSYGPRSARGVLRYAEQRNETVERALLHGSARDVPKHAARDADGAFPVYYISDSIPMWDEKVRGQWMLDVGGLVAHPLRLTLDDLMGLPRVTQRVDHYCVEGWTAVASWTGVRLRDLAALVQPHAAARYVDFQSFDKGYHESWDIESATHPQTLVAYGMDGRMLGAGHGAPARVHSPVKLGYKNTKYLTKIVFMSLRNGGYWSDEGYEWYGGV